MRKTFDDIGDMLKAGYPLLYLVTTEYNRITQKIRKTAFDLNYEFHSWDLVDGLRTHLRNNNNRLDNVAKHQAHVETMGYQEILEYIKHHAESDPRNCHEVFMLEDFHKFFRDDKVIVYFRKLTDILKEQNKHVVLIGPYAKLPDELEKFVTLVNVPLPDKQDLEIRLDHILDKKKINADQKDHLLRAAMGLTDMEAHLAFKLAENKGGLSDKGAVRIINSEKEQIISKSRILDYYNGELSLENSVGGLEKLKSWLKQRKMSFDRKAKSFGLKEPKGILLLGVPGCGKSLTAKCVANEWKQPLLRLDIGKVFQAEVGSSENNIRMAIATAEAVAPCVLWIDEIEKGLGASSGERDGGTNSRVFSTILTWMQEKTHPVFVVATANNISDLPPELLRKGRFDEIFYVDLPTHSERKKIFDIHLQNYGQDSITDLDELADRTRYFNGAEIEEVVKEAMFLSYLDDHGDQPIGIRHLLKAIQNIVPLSRTMSKKITDLRNWARVRARQASSEPNEEKLETDNLQESEYQRALTRAERNEDIF